MGLNVLNHPFLGVDKFDPNSTAWGGKFGPQKMFDDLPTENCECDVHSLNCQRVTIVKLMKH